MEKHKIKKIIIAVILFLIALFIIISMVSLNPEKTVFNAKNVDDFNKHIFGYFGLLFSSYFFRIAGYSSFVIALGMIHTGYLLVSNRKKIYLYSGISAWIIEMFLFSIFLSIKNGRVNNIQSSGGIIGVYFANLIGMNNTVLLKLISLALFLIVLVALLYKPFLKRTFEILGKYIKKRRKIKRSIPKKAKPTTDKLESMNKLPFIRKIYIYTDVDENKIKINSGIDESSKRENYGESIKTNVIDESGQLELPDIRFNNKENKEHVRENDYRIINISSSFLKKSKSVNSKEIEKETVKKAKELERTLKEFGIEAKVTGIIRGPVITRYELQPAPGVKLNRIINLSDNIALNLSANGVRIQAPIPGRSAVGIEIPNEIREIVTLGDIIDRADIKGELPLILGKDVSGNIVVSDLAEMPHLLIAGATGSGKSVCVNSLILSLLFKKSPDQVKFLMIDPKMVELKIYNGIPHLLTEVITDPKKAARSLRWVIHEMENRYQLLDEYRVRDIKGYNSKAKEKLPYIVVIIDEFANLMAISQKDVEDAVVRLAAMSRAVGIHLIMATQRPSVDVITGLIKANFPYRIAFQVASKTDSRTILDTSGAEKLLGRGDMLFSPAGSMNLIRIQGAYVSEDEVIQIVNELRKSADVEYRDIFDEESEESMFEGEEDPIYDDAVEIVVKTRRASASFLQRRLKIGYNRAARLIEMMEERGIIGPPRGSKPREIFVDSVD